MAVVLAGLGLFSMLGRADGRSSTVNPAPLLSAATAAPPKTSAAPSASDLQVLGTLDDLALVGTAVRSYFQHNSSAPGFRSEPTNFDQLYAALVPAYIPDLPKVDRWGTALKFVLSRGGYRYRVISAGADRVFDEHSEELPDIDDEKQSAASSDDLIFDNQRRTVSPPASFRLPVNGEGIQLLTRTHAALRDGETYLAQGWLGNAGRDSARLVAVQGWKCANGQMLVNRDGESTSVRETVRQLEPGEVAFFQLSMQVTGSPRFEQHLNRPPREVEPLKCQPRGELLLEPESGADGALKYRQVESTREWFLRNRSGDEADAEHARVTRERMQKFVEAVSTYNRAHPRAFVSGFVKDRYPQQLAEAGLEPQNMMDGWGRPLRVLEVREDEYYLISVGADGRLDHLTGVSNIAGEDDRDESQRTLALSLHLNSEPYPAQAHVSSDQDLVVRVRDWSNSGVFVQGGPEK